MNHKEKEKFHITSNCFFFFFFSSLGVDLSVAVSSKSVDGAYKTSGARPIFSYAPPEILSVTGCVADNDMHSLSCSRYGGEKITITGENFGRKNARNVFFFLSKEFFLHESVAIVCDHITITTSRFPKILNHDESRHQCYLEQFPVYQYDQTF